MSAELSMDQALRLDPRNFTSVQDTPWAGTRIAQSFKRRFALPSQRIGESWEVSCDPLRPSRVVSELPEFDDAQRAGYGMSEQTVLSRQGPTLAECIRRDPRAMLSPRFAGHENCQILVKLLNADSPLSLQVHPADDDPNLLPGECGKPESWLVLDADPGAGLYLGFSRALTSAALAELLRSGDDSLSEMLQFAPAGPGDYFEIPPGVPHAIGPGLTLLEPQRILPGKSGKTYRMYDWGRRYDDAGHEVPRASGLGKVRQLHLDAALGLVRPQEQVGLEFVASLRRAPTMLARDGVEVFSYPASPYYQLHRLRWYADAPLPLTLRESYAAMVLVGGDVKVCSATSGKQVPLSVGESAFLPAAALPAMLRGYVGADLCLLTPAAAGPVV